MKIANVLPRRMNFGALNATSIDLCVRDFTRASRHRQSTTVVCRETEQIFEGVAVRTFAGGSVRRCVKQVASILRGLRPDLIVVHQHLPSAVAISARFPEVPVILHKHNFTKRTTGWRHYFHNRQYGKIAGIVFVSEACRAAFARDYPGARPALFVVHNGLPLSDWPGDVPKSNEIVAVGLVEPEKGSPEIIEALVKVLPDYPDWRAKILGNVSNKGGFGDRVKAAIDSCGQLDLTGYIPFAEVVSATGKARIAVVNSRKEPFGRVAIEAFAARAALISSVAGGLSEVVGEAALRLETGSREEIEACLRTLIENPQRREQLAMDGRARFERHFTIDTVSSQLDTVYETVRGRSIRE